MSYADLFHRFGLLLPEAGETVWLFGGKDQIETAYGTVDTALRDRPGYRLIIAAPSSALAEVRQRYPHEIVLPLPVRLGGARWRRRLDPALVIFGTEFRRYAAAAPRSLAVVDVSANAIVETLPEFPKSAAHSAPRSVPPLIGMMAGQPIGGLDELSRRLGTPQEILCLGNGPSSEDPRVMMASYECLFRVNWIWRERGLFLSPAMVFTADPDVPRGSPQPILGFPNSASGRPILWRNCLRLQPPRQGYAFIDALLPALGKWRGSLPSNGAIMIAVAAALQPSRIIIAGMDLYDHAEGRYPGDRKAVDGYSREHDRASDIDFIRQSLAAYRGELMILSDRLREAIEASSGPAHVDDIASRNLR